jgi:hypothetical protein
MRKDLLFLKTTTPFVKQQKRGASLCQRKIASRGACCSVVASRSPDGELQQAPIWFICTGHKSQNHVGPWNRVGSTFVLLLRLAHLMVAAQPITCLAVTPAVKHANRVRVVTRLRILMLCQ